MFNLATEELEKLGAAVTVKEIKQQPVIWEETFAGYKRQSAVIEEFLNGIKAKHDRVRVIFTGAGSSAYAGDVVLPYLKEVGDEERFEFQSVATTNLVSNPASYFKANVPTVLVSFSRSGNSPESLASVELGQSLVKDFYQITITCAAEGKLASKAIGDERNLVLLMPEAANDQGFAMTGSFTSMLLTATLIFDPTSVQTKESYINQISKMGSHILEREQELQELVDQDFNRVIYLGSGALGGIAREVQLKILELTAGKIATAFDTPLGFRHGPKSFVDDKSLVFLFVSNDPYTRQYDLDMLEEMQGDQIAKIISSIEVTHERSFSGKQFAFDREYAALPDAYLALPYTLFGQMISLLTSLKVENRPDTPSPTGTVNRVVKGVTIYDHSE